MKALAVIWLVVFISLMGYGITTVPFPLVADQLGASAFWKSFGGPGIYSTFQLLAMPLWGRLSDAYGRRPVLLVTMAGAVAGYLWLATADSLFSLLAARAVGGVMSGNLVTAMAYATDITPNENRARSLGVVGSAYGVGFAAGPPLGGWLGELANTGGVSLYWPCLVAAALSVIATVGTFILLRESLDPQLRRPFGIAPALRVENEEVRSDFWSRWRAFNPRMTALFIASLAVGFGSSALQSIFPFWARSEFGLSLRRIGLLFAGMGALAAVSQMLLIGPVSQRFGERAVTNAALCVVLLSLLTLQFAHGEASLWVGVVLFGLAIGLFFPASSSLATGEAAPDRRGAVLGAINAAGTAGRIAGPALAGPLYFGFGSWTTFVVGGVLTLLSLWAMQRGYALTGSNATE